MTIFDITYMYILKHDYYDTLASLKFNLNISMGHTNKICETLLSIKLSGILHDNYLLMHLLVKT